MRLAVALLFLAFAVPSNAQKTPSSPKQNPTKTKLTTPKPSEQSVYSLPWESGEIKWCNTFSGQPKLLECDGTKMDWPESFINLLGDNALAGDEEAQMRAISYALTHSKQFLVSFSRDPWPKPQTGRKVTTWDCTKDKRISCSFGTREK